ncbi:MAG: esterase/lipase family protein [Candidatus Binatia bacterium]
MQKQTRLQGVIELATAALGGGLATVEGVHTAIARKPFSVLRFAPAVGEVSEAARAVHDGITGLVYGGMRMAIAATGGAARLAAGAAAAEDAEPRAGSLSDLAVAALNGFAGERLERTGNPLASQMSLRHAGRSIRLERAALAEAFPSAAPRLAVFVHGLACNETVWRLHAERHYDNRQTTYGARLEADLGYTPLYVRYNTGLHISENGRRLAQLLDRAVAEWPVPVEELVLVGHSMGGLVVRSATHYGSALDWVRRVRHVFFLASPHLGAPLEKVANVAAWMLDRFDVTRPFAAVLNGRSAGIKDLRFGALRDEDWQGVDLDALLADRTGDIPLLDGAAHYFIAATVTRDPHHPLGVAVGDLLVRRASAFGRGRLRRMQFPIEHGRHFGPMHHLELLNHPDLYAQMHRWLERGSAQR